MSGKILKRALALCLCMLLLAGSCLAEDSLEDFVPDALTEEELPSGRNGPRRAWATATPPPPTPPS